MYVLLLVFEVHVTQPVPNNFTQNFDCILFWFIHYIIKSFFLLTFIQLGYEFRCGFENDSLEISRYFPIYLFSFLFIRTIIKYTNNRMLKVNNITLFNYIEFSISHHQTLYSVLGGLIDKRVFRLSERKDLMTIIVAFQWIHSLWCFYFIFAMDVEPWWLILLVIWYLHTSNRWVMTHLLQIHLNTSVAKSCLESLS